MAEPPIDWENDPVILTAKELAHIGEIASRYRDRLLDEMEQAYPDRWAHALVAATAMLFTSSMTDDADQQAGVARILNAIMARWAPHEVPWRLVPGDSGPVSPMAH